MKVCKTKFNKIYIRFLGFFECIEINLKTDIYNEQFSSLSFFLHFISTQQFSHNNNLSFPKDGWITLDKIFDHDVIIKSFCFNYSQFQDFCKFIKKKISYDLRCLKKFEQDLFKNQATIKFIEDIATSDLVLFKRVQLRQLKRVFNQSIALCEFKTKNQPSKFYNLRDVWQFILESIEKWAILDDENSRILDFSDFHF